MHLSKGFKLPAVVLVFFLSGCMHHQLRFDTVNQVKTVSNIYEQQVLDNLAMFCNDPNGLPFFSIPSSGAASVSDSLDGSAGAPLNPFFTTLGFSTRRSHDGRWTLETVKDAAKLRRMRCAYQKAVGYTSACIDCSDLKGMWVGKPVSEGGEHCEICPGFYCCTNNNTAQLF